MGKDTKVEIPQGSGNHYRYEYQDGATKYRGPVGSAPEIGEEEFLDAMIVDWEPLVKAKAEAIIKWRNHLESRWVKKFTELTNEGDMYFLSITPSDVDLLCDGLKKDMPHLGNLNKFRNLHMKGGNKATRTLVKLGMGEKVTVGEGQEMLDSDLYNWVRLEEAPVVDYVVLTKTGQRAWDTTFKHAI